ncbi:hypothetical protein ACWDQL_13905 [Streptomyces olivaceus]
MTDPADAAREPGGQDQVPWVANAALLTTTVVTPLGGGEAAVPPSPVVPDASAWWLAGAVAVLGAVPVIRETPLDTRGQPERSTEGPRRTPSGGAPSLHTGQPEYGRLKTGGR